MSKYQDRVIEMRKMKSSELMEHPENIRRHDAVQKGAVETVLEDIGKVSVLHAYHSEKFGRLVIFDGHLRRGLDTEWSVIITDLDDKEVDNLLITYDATGEMAEYDRGLLRKAVESQEAESHEMERLLEKVCKMNGVEFDMDDDNESSIKRFDVNEVPVMTWVLVGIPTVQYPKYAEQFELLGAEDGVYVDIKMTDAKAGKS